MLAIVVGGWCYKTSSEGCPANTKIVPPFVGLVAAFVLVGLIGIVYLAIRGRRG